MSQKFSNRDRGLANPGHPRKRWMDDKVKAANWRWAQAASDLGNWRSICEGDLSPGLDLLRLIRQTGSWMKHT